MVSEFKKYDYFHNLKYFAKNEKTGATLANFTRNGIWSIICFFIDTI